MLAADMCGVAALKSGQHPGGPRVRPYAAATWWLRPADHHGPKCQFKVTARRTDFVPHTGINGEYIADIIVEDAVILELKALDRISEIHKAQTLNYLKATNYRLALLINFGKYKLEYERLIL